MLLKKNVKFEKKEAKNGIMVNRGLSEHLLLQNLTSFCTKGSCSCNSGNLPSAAVLLGFLLMFCL